MKLITLSWFVSSVVTLVMNLILLPFFYVLGKKITATPNFSDLSTLLSTEGVEYVLCSHKSINRSSLNKLTVYCSIFSTYATLLMEAAISSLVSSNLSMVVSLWVTVLCPKVGIKMSLNILSYIVLHYLQESIKYNIPCLIIKNIVATTSEGVRVSFP